ncbi:hypothetical protein Tco_0565578 [Tanacetum coccineum]
MVEGWMVLELSRREAEEKSNLKTSLARGWYLCLRTFGFPADLASFGLHDVATPALVRILSYHVRWLVLPLNKKCSGFPVSKDPVVLREGGRITTKKYPTKDWYRYFSVRMTKVIKGEFKKIKDVKVEDVPLTCDATLEIYWIRGDDEVELTDEESGLKPMKITKTIGSMNGKKIYHGLMRNHGLKLEFRQTKTKDSYCNGGNLPGAYHIGNSIHYQDLEWYEALEDSELKDEALRNKAIMEGFIWEYENETHEEGHELCSIKTREVPVCQLKRYKMIKYSFNDEEEYVAVKEDEYDDLTFTSEEACRAYQEIFRMMDEGCMVTRTK